MVLIISAAGMSLLVLCWFVALRTMNRGNATLLRSHERLSRQSAELAQMNAELDSKVAQRTRALEQEVVERTRAQDDQARASADLELQAVELRRYADVFRNMQVGLNVWCLQDREDLRSFKLISTNPAAAHSFGVRTEDILGKRMDDAFPHMLDTDHPRQYREVLSRGGTRPGRGARKATVRAPTLAYSP